MNVFLFILHFTCTDYMYLVRGHNVLYNTTDVSHVE